MLKASPSLFPNLLGTSASARAEFYDKFQREADELDKDFMKRYGEDLNTTLILVCFSFRIPVGCGVHLIFRGVQGGFLSPWLHPFSLSTSRVNSHRISNK